MKAIPHLSGNSQLVFFCSECQCGLDQEWLQYNRKILIHRPASDTGKACPNAGKTFWWPTLELEELK